MRNNGLIKSICIMLAITLASFCAHGQKIATIRSVTNSDTETVREVKLKDLGKDTFRLEIPKDKIAKNLKYIDILLPDASAKKGEDGYWVLSDGRMGFFNKDSGQIYERRNPMPLYGVKKGDSAFVAIVKGLKYEFAMNVEVKGGLYKIFPRFLIGEMGQEPYQDLIIDFKYFSGADANYSAMGRAYREYQLGRGEVKPLRERVKYQPTLAYTIDSIFFRVKFGWKEYKKNKIAFITPENEPPVVVQYTFDDFIDIAKKLKEIGVNETEMCFVGWNYRGFEGRLPDLFPVDPLFGGEKKMKEAVRIAQGLGFQVVCHVCNVLSFSCSKRFSYDDVAKNASGSLNMGACLAGGRSYRLCFKCVDDKIIDEDIEKMLALGVKGTHHVDVTSAITPYPCHDPKHFCNRQQTADYMNSVGQKCRDSFGGFGSEGSCDHVAKTMDFALYVWAYPDWLGKKNALVDRLVPIWQIAYHGIILSNPYYATIDYNYVEPRRWSPYNGIMDEKIRRLKMAEFNGRPVFYFANYKKSGLGPVKEAYDEYKKLRHLQYEYMDFHGEIAKNVFVSEFSNGECVVVNYSGSDYAYNGNIVKAGDYMLMKKEE